MFKSLLKRISATFNWFKYLFTPEQLSCDIRIMGDRASGKTTYLAALAKWPNPRKHSPVEAIIVPNNKSGDRLKHLADNLIGRGSDVQPTPFESDILAIDDYGLEIIIKKEFSSQLFSKSSVKLELNFKDYSGEFFRKLLKDPNSPVVYDYINRDIKRTANGILLLVDGNAYWQDSLYQQYLEKLMIKLDKGDQKRMAVVITKCEMGSLRLNRHKPKWLVQRLFPELYQRVQIGEQFGVWEANYFACSVFGTTGELFKSENTNITKKDQDGVAAVLLDPSQWRPFGLVYPIYWLCTGRKNKTFEKLDKE